MNAAAAYARSYLEQLTSVIANEVYTQRIAKQLPIDYFMPRTRTLKSEIFFMVSPREREWMAIRDVLTLDGKPVDDRPDLREALRTLDPAAVGRTFKAYNSRFNLGRVKRNFNEPTFSLVVLDDRHRAQFDFSRLRTERKAGATLVTLEFVEKRVPTLVVDLNGHPVFSRGQFTIEQETGQVTKALLGVKIGGVRMELATVYAPDPKLGILVPQVFRETYEEGVDTLNAVDSKSKKSVYESILCEAKYTNYRRFETSVRVK